MSWWETPGDGGLKNEPMHFEMCDFGTLDMLQMIYDVNE
jgi:hypothetical protein